MTVWPPKDPAERKLLRFKFANQLETGASIATVLELSCVVAQGEDPTPANVLDGVSTIVGTDVLRWAKDGLPGVRYYIRCLIQDSTGLKHLVDATLPVEAGEGN